MDRTWRNVAISFGWRGCLGEVLINIILFCCWLRAFAKSYLSFSSFRYAHLSPASNAHVCQRSILHSLARNSTLSYSAVGGSVRFLPRSYKSSINSAFMIIRHLYSLLIVNRFHLLQNMLLNKYLYSLKL